MSARSTVALVLRAGTRHSISTLLACALVMSMRQANAASMLRCEAADNSVRYASENLDNAKCSRVNLIWQAAYPPEASSVAPARAAASGDPGALASSVALPRRASLARREAVTPVYTYVEDGVRHYLTKMPVGVAQNVEVIKLHFMETCSLCAPEENIGIPALKLDLRSYQREIDAAASTFGVDSALVRAVIHAESAYRKNAISRAGAQGLMQLMPATALRFNVNDPFDAAQNIRGGVSYLAWLKTRFNGNVDLMLAAYNSGESSVDKYNGVPPYSETKIYVSRVKELTERYKSGK
ncbi:lytic transglycosylase domain-containing protein [Caballeronia sp. GAWG2-1]|uniref:lytic transglycosylase domain-containing protein n=1 Tax=Caballeronia sp. GAWG2-1 TaxID=2921744 RepID=UPI002027E53F|nr:lytic transglycosylase domain-containing protein [Caballeronia sp. GAWG2-1]